MKFKVVTKDIGISWVKKIGKMIKVCSFEKSLWEMYEKFGKPELIKDVNGQILLEWHIVFEDGVKVKIFNWVSKIDDIMRWHIMGYGEEALERINEVFGYDSFSFDFLNFEDIEDNVKKIKRMIKVKRMIFSGLIGFLLVMVLNLLIRLI